MEEGGDPEPALKLIDQERGQLEDDKTVYLTNEDRNVAPRMNVSEVAQPARSTTALPAIDLDARLPRAHLASAPKIDARAAEWLQLKEAGAKASLK